jgi:hypothetical protein
VPEANAKANAKANARAKPGHTPGALERYQLPVEVRESLKELRALSRKAEGGGAEVAEARKELRRKLREASPAVIARASDIGRKSQRLLIETASGGDPLTEEALSGRLDMMREEIAGENPTPLEVLLTERVVSGWLLVELFEALMAQQLWKKTPDEKRAPERVLRYHLPWQESANARFLAAVRELARVRKLEAGAPPIQVNTQVNVLRG